MGNIVCVYVCVCVCVCVYIHTHQIIRLLKLFDVIRNVTLISLPAAILVKSIHQSHSSFFFQIFNIKDCIERHIGNFEFQNKNFQTNKKLKKKKDMCSMQNHPTVTPC